MQELKGNIRVFCRVRPSLPDDGVGSEAIVSYPTAAESLGRGIDLMQNGLGTLHLCFAFHDVFIYLHNSVFIFTLFIGVLSFEFTFSCL